MGRRHGLGRYYGIVTWIWSAFYNSSLLFELTQKGMILLFSFLLPPDEADLTVPGFALLDWQGLYS